VKLGASGGRLGHNTGKDVLQIDLAAQEWVHLVLVVSRPPFIYNTYKYRLFSCIASIRWLALELLEGDCLQLEFVLLSVYSFARAPTHQFF